MTLALHLGTVRCSVCGYTYVRGLTGEARLHAAYHARWKRLRYPKPDLRFASCSDDVRVDENSPKWLHRAVYRGARALARERRYDFTQWGEDRAPRTRSDERDIHALLLVENGAIPVGVAGFSRIIWSDRDPGWHMLFAWIADEWRRRGVMSSRWPQWRETYGDFTLERPLSKAMRAFIAKVEAEAGRP